jgi:hypothetical protein
VINKRRYIKVLPDAGAATTLLLVLLKVLLIVGARIALLLVIIRILLGTRVLTVPFLGIMFLPQRWSGAMTTTLRGHYPWKS